MTHPEPNAPVVPPLLDFDTVNFQNNSSAHEYFSHLTRYLINVTIISSRPRLYALIPLDKFTGMVWLIIVPIIYFVAIGLILAILLSFFWYADGRGVVSAAQSEASVASTAGSSIMHDTVIVSDASNQSTRHSIVLNYLRNTAEFHASFRTSKASKGSTRSLEVLPEKDIQLRQIMAASVEGKDFSADNRRLSHSIHECRGNNIGTADNPFILGPHNSLRGWLAAGSSNSHVKMSDLLGETLRNDASFSTDSCKENISSDSLRASMESQKHVWAASEEIGPEDFYCRDRERHESTNNNRLRDINKRYNADNRTVLDNMGTGQGPFFRNTEKHNTTVFENSVFTDQCPFFRDTEKHNRTVLENGRTDQASFFQDTDEYLQKTYKTAVNMDKKANAQGTSQRIVVPYKTASNSLTNSQNPANRRQVQETSTFSRACIKNRHLLDSTDSESEWKIAERRNGFVSNTESNVYNIHMSPYPATVSPIMSSSIDSHNANLRTRKFRRFPVSSSSNKFELCIYNEEKYSPNVVKNEDDDQRPEVDNPDLDISSVSQNIVSSQEQLDHTQNSHNSSLNGRDEGSLGSASNSLPSSIARYHASKVGYFTSPSAGYPFHCDENNTPDKTVKFDDDKDLHNNGSHDNHPDLSLRAIFGSCSQSSSPVNAALLSQENSLNRPQYERDCYHDNSNNYQGFVKLSKRPSPLSSFVHNLRQRCSLDDNFLKVKRAASDEEEALIALSPMHKPSGDKKYRSLELDVRNKVSVEQRLQEFGFLKNNGRNKYVINPAPGKYETGSGYFNHVFMNCEDTPSRFRYVDCEYKQFRTPDMQILKRDSYRQHKVALSDRCRPKPTISQHLEGCTNLYQHQSHVKHMINQMERPSFQDKNNIYWEDKCSDNKWTKRKVIEIHNEPNQKSAELCLGLHKSQAEQNIEVGNPQNMSHNRQPHHFNHHEFDSTRSSDNKSKGIFERRRQNINERKEKAQFDTPSNFQTQLERLASMNESTAKNTHQKNATLKLFDIGHSATTASKIDLTTIPKKSGGNSMLVKGNKLKRQHTHRALISPEVAVLNVLSK